MLTKLSAEPSATTRQPATAQGPVDHGVLDRLLGSDRAAEREIFEQFLASVPTDAERFGAALGGAQRKLAVQFAHRMKGACRMVGATPLGDVCERAERDLGPGRTARRDEAALFAALQSDLARETARVVDYLRAWLRPGGDASTRR